MDQTLQQILTALFQAHAAIDDLNHRIEMLRDELAEVREHPGKPE